ncbi:MAG: hypothetical protein COA60_006755 [Robiginitomaculum sp.]|nr:hypothetical protein [Robiginitomaculum sp.]
MNNFIKAGAIAIAFLGLSFAATPISANKAKIMKRVCIPLSVAVFLNRIQVKCKKIPSKAYTEEITYYAMAIASRNSKQVDYTLQVLLTAKASNRNLQIWFGYDDYSSVPGCKEVNCRRLTGVSLR